MKIKLHNDWSWPTSFSNTSDARWAAALLPPHRTVVVACGGSALMSLPLSMIEVHNDLQGHVYEFFRVVRDPRSRSQLLELIESKTAPLAQVGAVRSEDPILIAYQFYRACRRSWVPDLSARWLSRRHDSRPFFDSAKLLNPIIDRFRSPQIEDLSADNVITRYDKPQAVHLVDLSLAKAEAIPAILAALANIAGKAVVLGSTAAERELLPTWRVVVQPFGAAPHTALVNFSDRKRAA